MIMDAGVVWARVSHSRWRHIRWPADTTLRHVIDNRFRCQCNVFRRPNNLPAIPERYIKQLHRTLL